MKLEAKGITFGYQKGLALFEDFQLTINRGERVGLIAPSGFGKTTLCQLLAGYLAPTKGQVLLDGQAVHTIKGYCPVQMIWQHPEKSVNPRLRMEDILAEGGVLKERVIQGLGIETTWLKRFPAELSGGELQRFCIARALGQETTFLIADEISTMLDPITQSQIWNFLLQEVTERQMGLIAVTHSQALLEQVTQRQVVLEGYSKEWAVAKEQGGILQGIRL